MKHTDTIISQYIEKAVINSYVENKRLNKRFIYAASSKLKIPAIVIRIHLKQKKSEIYKRVYRLKISKTLNKLSSQTGIDKDKIVELALLNYINLKKPNDFLILIKILLGKKEDINILDIAVRLPNINIKHKIYKLKHSIRINKLSSQTGIDKDKIVELALLNLLKLNKRDIKIFIYIYLILQSIS